MPSKSGSEALVSIIIPCDDPTHFLRETVSVRWRKLISQ